MSEPEFPEPLTDYQKRLYNALLYGRQQGAREVRRAANRTVRVLWLSRRRMQAEVADLRSRLSLVEALCTNEQLRANDPEASVSARLVNYAINPDLYDRPDDFNAALLEAREYLR